MKAEQLREAVKINGQIETLKNNVKYLKRCNRTLGITHWSNYEIAYNTYTEVSQDIINAIIAEFESRIEQLQKEFNAL